MSEKELNKSPEYTIDDRSIQFNFEDKEYTLRIGNTGDYMDWIDLKNRLTKGVHAEMLSLPTKGNQHFLILAYTEAAISVYVPDLYKDLGAKSLRELDMLRSRKLALIYKDKVAPFMEFWERVFEDPEEVMEEGFADNLRDGGGDKNKSNTSQDNEVLEEAQDELAKMQGKTYMAKKGPLAGEFEVKENKYV